MDLIPHLVKSRKLKETSINNYVRNIRTLHGKKPFDNVKWLTDTDAILEKIKDYSIKTKRNMITSVIVVLKAIDEKEFEAALTKYKSMLLDMNKEINTEYQSFTRLEGENVECAAAKGLCQLFSTVQSDCPATCGKCV